MIRHNTVLVALLVTAVCGASTLIAAFAEFGLQSKSVGKIAVVAGIAAWLWATWYEDHQP